MKCHETHSRRFREMIEIKFRGKRTATGEWVYGGYHKHQVITPAPIIPKGEKRKPIEYQYLILQSGFSDWNMPKPIDAVEVDPETVGQYIGLQDPKRNDASVYVGDIYNWLGIIRAITVDDTHGYRFMFGKDQICRNHITEGEYLGNIYEHPDLVKE